MTDAREQAIRARHKHEVSACRRPGSDEAHYDRGWLLVVLDEARQQLTEARESHRVCSKGQQVILDRLNGTVKQLAESRDVVTTWEVQHDEMRKVMDVIKQERDEARAENTLARNIADKLRVERDEARADRDSWQRMHEALDEEFKKLHGWWDEARATIARLEQERDEARQRLDGERTAVTWQLRVLGRLQARAEAAEDHVKKLKANPRVCPLQCLGESVYEQK